MGQKKRNGKEKKASILIVYFSRQDWYFLYKSLKLSTYPPCMGYINHQILPTCRLNRKKKFIVKNKCPHNSEQERDKKIYFPKTIPSKCYCSTCIGQLSGDFVSSLAIPLQTLSCGTLEFETKVLFKNFPACFNNKPQERLRLQ